MNSIKIKLTPIEYFSVDHSIRCQFLNCGELVQLNFRTSEFYFNKIKNFGYPSFIAYGELRGDYNPILQTGVYIYSENILILGDLK